IMGLEFLARVRRSSIWLGAITSLLVASYRSPGLGLAIATGAAWSLVNLLLLEKLIVALTGADRTSPDAARRGGGAIAGMLGLFAVGAFLLFRLSPIRLVLGFSMPFAVIAFKAASPLLLGSPLWRSVTRSPWRAALVIAVIGLGTWWTASGWTS